MFLTPDDLIALTGKTQHRAQRRQLDILGIAYRVRGDGSLVVLKLHVEHLDGARVAKLPEPNWSACA